MLPPTTATIDMHLRASATRQPEYIASICCPPVATSTPSCALGLGARLPPPAARPAAPTPRSRPNASSSAAEAKASLRLLPARNTPLSPTVYEDSNDQRLSTL
eukprot:scaffold21812_cov110-Isochrysis_galbana.AAC.13